MVPYNPVGSRAPGVLWLVPFVQKGFPGEMTPLFFLRL